MTDSYSKSSNDEEDTILESVGRTIKLYFITLIFIVIVISCLYLKDKLFTKQSNIIAKILFIILTTVSLTCVGQISKTTYNYIIMGIAIAFGIQLLTHSNSEILEIQPELPTNTAANSLKTI